jgi:hypothetical protein
MKVRTCDLPPQQFRVEAGALGKDCFEHVAIDVAFDLRRLADAEERHRVKIGGRERHAHLADALRVDTDLESQAVGAADKFARAGHGDKARAAKLVEDGPRRNDCVQVGFVECGAITLCRQKGSGRSQGRVTPA